MAIASNFFRSDNSKANTILLGQEFPFLNYIFYDKERDSLELSGRPLTLPECVLDLNHLPSLLVDRTKRKVELAFPVL